MRSIRLISYIKKDKFIRRYDGEWAGRDHATAGLQPWR